MDAVINALTIACKQQMQFDRTEYKVDIRDQGVDALVNVELRLMKDNRQS